MDSVCNSFGLKLLELCKTTSICIVNGRFFENTDMHTFVSRQGCSVIDYLLIDARNRNILRTFNVHDLSAWSDHTPLSFHIQCSGAVGDGSHHCNRGGSAPQESGQTFHKWDDDKRDAFRRAIIGKLPQFNNVVNSIDLHNFDSINSAMSKFTSLLYSSGESLFSVSKRCDHNKSHRLVQDKEWFDGECKQARHKYLIARNTFNQIRSTENRTQMCDKKAIYKSIIKKKKRRFEFVKCRQLERLRHKKPKDFWKFFCRNNHKVNDTILLDDFFSYFSNLQHDLIVSTDTSSSERHLSDLSATCIFEELDRPISATEIRDIIKSLKRGKSCGMDNLINEYLIETFDILSAHIVDLFNAILNSGCFPNEWSRSIIIPIHKKGDPKDVNNYRGISLVSCFSKVFTGVLNKRLNDWADSNSVLSDAQFGFRKGCSTTDAVFVLHAFVQKVLTEKGRLFCAFIDLKKAFDSVPLNNLWFKLIKSGVTGKVLKIIYSMYSNITATVRACNSYSQYFDCVIGLKQGEVMSPLLFSMFIEDLELFLQDDIRCGLSLDDMIFVLMLYADDMVILGNSASDLQQRLDLLQLYCNKWGLTVNADKSKIVVFRKKGCLRNDEFWFYGSTSLEIVNDFNYLGVVFNFTGSFVLNIEYIVGKASKAMNVFMLNTRGLPFSTKVLCQLFDSFVGSILCYGCEVWGFGKSKDIERVHLKFCKRILQVKTSTSN